MTVIYESARSNALRLLRLMMEAWAGGPVPGLEEALDRAELVTLGPADVLFSPGEPHPYIYYNLQGALRVQTIVDTRAVTTGIRLEGEIIADLSGLGLTFVRRAAALDLYPGSRRLIGADTGATRHLMVAIEPALLLRFDMTDLSQLMDAHPEWQRIFTSYLAMHSLKIQADLALFRTGTPAQRYSTLLKERPELVRRITQRELAGLLGISEAGLSRVVKRLNGLAAERDPERAGQLLPPTVQP